MLFQRSIVGASRSAAEQWAEVTAVRNAFNLNENSLMQMNREAGFAINGGLIPQDVYQEFDNVTVERFRSDDGDTFLNDLLPLSRSVSIGKLTHKFRKASDAGVAQTSMTGQIGVKMDQVEYTYDGSIIPIHDTGFFRQWREWNAQRSEGFDGLIDDQRESVASLRAHTADQFMDGHVDTDGNAIVVDGISWAGMRGDSRVAQIDLGASGINFDFTLTTNSYALNEAAFKQVINVLWITNNSGAEATYYVSREIASNWERQSSESYAAEKFVNRMAQLMGVREIKVSNKLTGNQMMAFPLDAQYIRPIVGMGINTVAMPRPVYNSNYEFAVWGAIGFEVRTDFANRKACSYASEIT